VTVESISHYHANQSSDQPGSQIAFGQNEMKASKGETLNYGLVVVEVFLAIDATIMGITFSLGLMLPLMSEGLDVTLGHHGPA
jgi:hypothetical protein